MNSAKVALSMPAEDEKLRRDELSAILDALDAEHGKPTKAAMTWAKRVLKPSS
jgi:hypothetical protein